MKLIESKAELIQQKEGLDGMYKQIELAGRTAYHSLDKITPDSAKDFVDRMIKSKHGAALEHGTVYLDLPNSAGNFCAVETYSIDKYCRMCIVDKQDRVHNYVTTNYRCIIENNWLDDFQYLCSPTEFHEKRYTIRFTCSRAIAQELTRHRVFSFLMESQRYVNYSKERHGGEITCINNPNGQLFPVTYCLMDAYKYAEKAYFKLLEKGCTPQQARDVLPNATKTELIMTGFASDWRFFFDLRFYGKTGKPHPDMELLASKAREEFIKAGLWDDIMKYPSKFDKDDTERETN